MAFRSKSFKSFQLFPLCSEADPDNPMGSPCAGSTRHTHPQGPSSNRLISKDRNAPLPRPLLSPARGEGEAYNLRREERARRDHPPEQGFCPPFWRTGARCVLGFEGLAQALGRALSGVRAADAKCVFEGGIVCSRRFQKGRFEGLRPGFGVWPIASQEIGDRI